MKPCTSINVHFDPSFSVPVEEQIQRVYDAGFRHMDMNFWDWSHDPASPFRKDDWRKWVDRIANKAASLGVSFTQAHADVFDFYTQDNSRYEMYLRSLEGAAMLNIPWVTFHPSEHPDFSPETEEQNLRDNIEYYKPLVEKAEKWKVGVALENMISHIRTARQLNIMVDALDSPFVGVCWDTGHAHVAGEKQGDSIRLMNSRLHALHIQDNDGVSDQHTAPYYGSINWDEVMDALHEIYYPGDFTFEAHMIVRKVPEGCRADALRLLYSIGKNLLKEA